MEDVRIFNTFLSYALYAFKDFMLKGVKLLYFIELDTGSLGCLAGWIVFDIYKYVTPLEIHALKSTKVIEHFVLEIQGTSHRNAIIAPVTMRLELKSIYQGMKVFRISEGMATQNLIDSFCNIKT